MRVEVLFRTLYSSVQNLAEWNTLISPHGVSATAHFVWLTAYFWGKV